MKNVASLGLMVNVGSFLLLAYFWPTWKIGQAYPSGGLYIGMLMAVSWPTFYHFYLKDKLGLTATVSKKQVITMTIIVGLGLLVGWYTKLHYNGKAKNFQQMHETGTR